MVLVTGGASSGKSELAEKICLTLGEGRLYIATMRPYGEEAYIRIARHRAARAGRGFDTLECYENLHSLEIPRRYDTILLECMGNLVANQLFDAKTSAAETVDRVLAGVEMLKRQSDRVVIVTNDIFSGVEQYCGDMEIYLKCLAEVSNCLAHTATVVVESVCGLPLYLKGELAVE